MLTGNKFYNSTLNAQPLSGEVNYTDWGARPSVGSSYTGGQSFIRKPTWQRSASDWQIDKYAYTPVPTNNPYKTIDNYKTTLASVGEVAPQRKGAGLGNALMTVLDLMQRPQYMVTNVLQDLTDTKADSFVDVLGGALKGLSGERKSSFTDTLDNLGWENDPSKKWYQGGNLARNVAGFAGDVLLDPTTYLSAGTLSLAKGVGTKSVKEGIEGTAKKVLSETGARAFKIGTDAQPLLKQSDVAQGLIDILTKPGATLAETVASRDAAETLVETAIKKHGKQSDFVLRIAHALGDTTNAAPQLLGKRTENVVAEVLDKGVGALNRDVVGSISSPISKELDRLLRDVLPAEQLALSRSAGQIVNKRLGKSFSLSERLGDAAKQAETLNDIVDVLNKGKNSFIKAADRDAILSKLYDKAGKVFDPTDLPKHITEKEFDLMDTLLDAFGGDLGKGKTMFDLYDKANDLTRIKDKSLNKLTTLTKNYVETVGNIRRLDNGIEFANGLQRVFDVNEKAFFLRYHNPFTNTVKPLIELTNVAQSDVARKAWGALIEANPLKPVAEFVGTAVSGVQKKFSTEHISKKLANDSWKAYLDAKTFAHTTTEFIRKENAIPRRALAATKIFKQIEGFFDNESLRNIASLYVERNNSALDKAAWLYVSGADVASIVDDEVLQFYGEIATTPHAKQFLDSLGYKPEYEQLIVKAAAQNKLFNEAIVQFDGSNRIDFKDSLNKITDYEEAAASGGISPEGYARIYDNTPEAKNMGIPGDVKPLSGDAPSSGTRLSVADAGTGRATSARTGAFMHRKNTSAFSGLFYNPAGEYEFDLALRVARRTMESERVALNKKFVDGIYEFASSHPEFAKLVSEKNVKGYKAVPLMDNTITLYAHPEIANQLNRVTSLFDKRSVQEAAVDEIFANFSNVLKTVQTKYNPSFIIRNAIGEPLMNWIAGVSPKAHDMAWEIMRTVDADGTMFKIGNTTFAEMSDGVNKLYTEYTGKRPSGGMARILESPSGTKIFDDPIDIDLEKADIIKSAGVKTKYYNINGRQMTAQDIMNEFFDVGLGWSGITKGNEAKNMRGLLEQEMLSVSSKSGIGSALKTANQKAGIPGDLVETYTRLAHYIDSLQKGMDIQGAASEVRKFHVDYKDLTAFERKNLRSILPYYTYMRKNTPIQFKLLLERQNKINVIGQLVDSAYEAVQRDNNGEPLQVPDYLREGLAIPIGVDDDGNVSYLNWGIPIADVGRLKYDLQEMVTENFTSMLSPMIKTPLELSMNKNIMYGSDLERYEGQTKDLLPNVEGSPQIGTLADQLLQQFGVVNTARNALATGVSTAQSGEGSPLGAGLKKFFVGGVLPEKSQQEVGLQQAYDYRDQLYAHIQQLRAQGVNVPQYTPKLLSSPGTFSPTSVGNQIAENNRQGYLGVPTDQLFPMLLKLLTGQ